MTRIIEQDTPETLARVEELEAMLAATRRRFRDARASLSASNERARGYYGVANTLLLALMRLAPYSPDVAEAVLAIVANAHESLGLTPAPVPETPPRVTPEQRATGWRAIAEALGVAAWDARAHLKHIVEGLPENHRARLAHDLLDKARTAAEQSAILLAKSPQVVTPTVLDTTPETPKAAPHDLFKRWGGVLRRLAESERADLAEAAPRAPEPDLPLHHHAGDNCSTPEDIREHNEAWKSGVRWVKPPAAPTPETAGEARPECQHLSLGNLVGNTGRIVGHRCVGCDYKKFYCARSGEGNCLLNAGHDGKCTSEEFRAPAAPTPEAPVSPLVGKGSGGSRCVAHWVPTPKPEDRE